METVMVYAYFIVYVLFVLGLTRLFLRDDSGRQDLIGEVMGFMLALIVAALWPVLVLIWVVRFLVGFFRTRR